jgi:hypothetical protein
MHRCLDQLGADLAVEEGRLDAERARLAEAWGHFHRIVEGVQKAEEAARSRREEARCEVKEFRNSAIAEGAEILAKV